MSNILEVKNVVKQYGNYTALNEVSLTIPKGSIYGLLGPNGAGKTSLIRIINQITLPDNGEILLDGEKLKPEHVAVIGYMPEERGLYKTMKVGEQCLYLAQLKGLSKHDAKQQLDIGLTVWKYKVGGTKKFRNFPKEWLKKFNLWLLFYTNQNCLFSMNRFPVLIR